MDQYRELSDLLRRVGGKPQAWVVQGIVSKVEGFLCEVEIGEISIPEVRLRASAVEVDQELLIVPKVGSAVLIGSLSGDLTDLAVLSVDVPERILLGGESYGGLIKIEELTKRLNTIEEDINKLKQAFSSWAPVPNDGGASLKGGVSSWAGKKLQKSQRTDYENKKVLH